MFSSQLALRKHINVHEEKHKCQTFGTNYILKHHMKVHSKEKEFPCSSCNSMLTLTQFDPPILISDVYDGKIKY